MRLTEPVFSGVAVSLVLIASAATVPVLASESHPELYTALTRLEQARYLLNHSAYDFHGDREKALDQTQAAINEVQKALQSDRH